MVYWMGQTRPWKIIYKNILTTLLHVGEPQCQVILHKRAWQLARMNRFETEVNLCTYRKLVFQVLPQQ